MKRKSVYVVRHQVLKWFLKRVDANGYGYGVYFKRCDAPKFETYQQAFDFLNTLTTKRRWKIERMRVNEMA